jgi:hypothetical protein
MRTADMTSSGARMPANRFSFLNSTGFLAPWAPRPTAPDDCCADCECMRLDSLFPCAVLARAYGVGHVSLLRGSTSLFFSSVLPLSQFPNDAWSSIHREPQGPFSGH